MKEPKAEWLRDMAKKLKSEEAGALYRLALVMMRLMQPLHDGTVGTSTNTDQRGDRLTPDPIW